MAIITKEEVLKIAQMSHIAIHEDEIEAVTRQLQNVLSYAERVQEIATQVQIPSNKQINIFRPDVIARTNPEPILAQAPEREENFFVVPRILESNQ